MKKTMLVLLPLVIFSCKSAEKKEPEAALTNQETESTEVLPSHGDSDSNTAGGLQSINFGYDSFELTNITRDIIKKNAEYLTKNSVLKIQIEGHCDDRGSNQYNLALGENRAQAVKKYLTNLGVGSDRVSTVSYGEEKPVDQTSNEEAWARNRRANFVILAR